MTNSASRRNFLKTGAVAGAAAITGFSVTRGDSSAEDAKSSAISPEYKTLSVLQLNVWGAANVVSGGAEMLVDFIDRTNPDVALLCELDNGKLIQRLVEELAKRGKNYFQDGQNIQTGILSKYPLEKTSIIAPTSEPYATQVGKHRTITKAYLAISEQKIAIYSAHLDWEKYACYLPRGYDHVKWGTKLEKPTTDIETITLANRTSFRDEAIKTLIPDMKKETAKGNLVILGGDFNEPSHRDWQADTKAIRDHNGAVVNWDASLMLENAGFVDAYRRRYSNAVTHPGFTWPAANPVAETKGFCAKDADERDRIDFIYYLPQIGIELTAANIVGPAESVLRGKIAADKETDALLPQPSDRWFTDHKGNLASFQVSLVKTKNKINVDQKMSFAFLTDIHQNFANNKDRYNGFLQALNRVKDTDAEFILLGGDTVDVSGMGGNGLNKEQTDAMYAKYKKTMDDAGLPYYPAIGNHDRYYNKEEGFTGGDEIFKNYFGHSYQTFEKKGVRFFLVNSVQSTEKGGLSVGNEQLEWIKKELIRIPLATPIVVVTHVPVYSIYYPVVEGKASGADVIANFKEVLAVFREHNLQLVLQGHQHLYEEIFSQNVQYVTGGAVSAGWWSGAFHGTEEGFLLVHVDKENRFTWKYVDYGWSPK
ncbi:MAG: metallophosphoesterase [Planctomycetaceae bacterium]|jgi:predicted MPP superfamily phosphohydrolase/endonuclease/exonuclease/phosphatase family metal-dependent hydrolase|nr:metallophosphoesterase [Planctomycetaceae bacterium]